MSAGRKREFNKEEALDKAMRVFWENGYAGTSVANLTSTLGINKPSLYAAFGNKEQLFASAVEHYVNQYASQNADKLTNPPDAPLKERLSSYLSGIIDVICDCESPKGCMLVKSSIESGSVAVPCEIEDALNNIGLANEAALTELFEAEKRQGQLPPDTPVKDLTGYMLSMMYGLSVMARNGKTKEELQAVANMTINTLPGDA